MIGATTCSGTGATNVRYDTRCFVVHYTVGNDGAAASYQPGIAFKREPPSHFLRGEGERAESWVRRWHERLADDLRLLAMLGAEARRPERRRRPDNDRLPVTRGRPGSTVRPPRAPPIGY